MLWEQPNVSSKPFSLKISLAPYDSQFFNNSTVTDIVTIELESFNLVVVVFWLGGGRRDVIL